MCLYDLFSRPNAIKSDLHSSIPTSRSFPRRGEAVAASKMWKSSSYYCQKKRWRSRCPQTFVHKATVDAGRLLRSQRGVSLRNTRTFPKTTERIYDELLKLNGQRPEWRCGRVLIQRGGHPSPLPPPTPLPASRLNIITTQEGTACR